MATVDFNPPLAIQLPDPWRLCATSFVHSGRTAGTATVVLIETDQAQGLEDIPLTNSTARLPYAEQFAAKAGLQADVIDAALMNLYGQIKTRLAQGKAPQPTGPYYTEDAEGLWLVQPLPTGEHRVQLTNFAAHILADIVEDDGTPTVLRFFELEATQGTETHRLTLAAKDFQGMKWIPDVLGAQARIIPGKYHLEHAHAAIQDLSTTIERRHTYTHTGWRYIDDTWCYLHAAGAITAQGVRKDLSVALGEKFARYRLPIPPQGPDALAALRKSLSLRTLLADHLLTPLLGTVYLAPLREFLGSAPPDFTLWIMGKTGHYKSEYAALGMAHFGDFTRQTLPASFETTGNGLERLLHTPKDSLLIVDDYHPATTRREAEAMDQVAARLLRVVGNQGVRHRMRRDTTLQTELPPRCVAVATAERSPNGYSNAARMFLVSIPPMTPPELQTLGTRLKTFQDDAARYAEAMAVYLQWLAAHWDSLATGLPARLPVLRAEVAQCSEHAREPMQVAYLQLAWETFTACAVDCGALTPLQRQAMLRETLQALLAASTEHAAILAQENTVTRFLNYLRDGFASKQIYVGDPEDLHPPDASSWGWTETQEWDGSVKDYVPVQKPGHALLVGYVDDHYVYLIPTTLEKYLHQAARAENRSWPVDTTTLLRELESADIIQGKREHDGNYRRTVGKTIRKTTQRYVWVHRHYLEGEPDAEEDQNTAPLPF